MLYCPLNVLLGKSWWKSVRFVIQDLQSRSAFFIYIELIGNAQGTLYILYFSSKLVVKLANKEDKIKYLLYKWIESSKID